MEITLIATPEEQKAWELQAWLSACVRYNQNRKRAECPPLPEEVLRANRNRAAALRQHVLSVRAWHALKDRNYEEFEAVLELLNP